GELRPDAVKVVVQTARYLRTAIFSSAGLDEATRRTLLAEMYAEPLGELTTVKYLRGRIVGKPPLAPTGQAHPFCVWTTKLERVLRQDGRHSYQASEHASPMINTSVKIEFQSLEVWNGSKLTEQPPPEAQR